MIRIILILLFSVIRVSASEEKINYLENLTVENYDIGFNKDIYNYDIYIDDEEYLNIDYELSDDSIYVSVKGNGNFNDSDNIIEVNVNNDYKYVIHAHKSINTSFIVSEEINEMSDIKKEIVILFIIIISCLLVVGFYYILFINKTIVYI